MQGTKKEDTGHYTAVVWGKTTRVGCGITTFQPGNMYSQVCIVIYTVILIKSKSVPFHTAVFLLTFLQICSHRPVRWVSWRTFEHTALLRIEERQLICPVFPFQRIICNYWPSGNLGGAPVYTIASSAGAIGQLCATNNDGLCAPN